MVNKLLGVILMSISGPVQGIAMEYMIDKKSQKSTPVGRVLYWTIWGIVLSLINVFASNAVETQNARQILYWGSTLFALIYFYKDPLWRKFLSMMLVFFAFTMAEFGNYFAIQFRGISIEVLQDRTTNTAILYIGVGSLLSCISILILIVLWKKAFKKGMRLKYTWFIIVYACVQFIYQNVMTNSIYNSSMSGLEVSVVSLGMICIIVLLFTVFSQVEKQAMEEHLSEERLRNNLERIHYEEVKKRRSHVQKLMNSYKDELEGVKIFLEQNNIEKSENILISMIKNMEKTKEYPYCTFPVVNALLSQKQQTCQEKGIHLNISIKVGDNRNIDQIDLCRLFGNLLDNAIYACDNFEKDKYIKLSVGENDNYVTILCRNTAMKDQGLVPERSGYGMRIMKEIAEKYKGDFVTSFNKNEFTIRISMRK